MLILIAVRQLAWIALRLAQSILEFRWVDCVARRILQLVVDVLIVRSGIAHRANRLAYANQISPPHLLGLSMQDFVRNPLASRMAILPTLPSPAFVTMPATGDRSSGLLRLSLACLPPI